MESSNTGRKHYIETLNNHSVTIETRESKSLLQNFLAALVHEVSYAGAEMINLETNATEKLKFADCDLGSSK